MTATDDEREALARVVEEGWGNPTWDGVTLRPIDRQIADAILAAGFRRQGPIITDAQVHAAYRGFCEARKGGGLAEGEYEAVFSRVEFAWIRAALEAARGVA